MSSQLPSPPPIPDKGGLNISAWFARKPIDKASLTLGASDNLFDKVFALIQQNQDNQPRAASANNAQDTQSNATGDQNAPAPDKSSDSTRPATKDSGDEKPASQNSQTDSSGTAPVKTRAEVKHHHHIHHVCDIPPAENVSAGNETPLPQAVAADTPDAPPPPPAPVSTASNVQTTPNPDPALQAALCVAPLLKTQEQSTATGDQANDTSKEQAEAAQTASLQSLLSFRANSAVSLPTSGKKSSDNSAKPEITTELEASLKTEIKSAAANSASSAPALKEAASAQAQPAAPQDQNVQENTGFDFLSLMQNLPQLKKDVVQEKTAAAADTATELPQVNADSPVLPTPPATGSRVNAPLGFSAPALTGSGGGSFLSAKAAGGLTVEAASNTGFAEGPTSFGTTGAIQLVRAANTNAALQLPPSLQVGVAITRMVKNGTDRFDVQLNPADLGKVDIRLEIDKDNLVRVTVTADNPQTYDMLQKDSRALQQVLQQAGLQTDSGSLSFNLRGDAQTPQQDAQQGAPTWRRWMDNTLAAEPTPQATTYVATQGRVDFTV